MTPPDQYKICPLCGLKPTFKNIKGVWTRQPCKCGYCEHKSQTQTKEGSICTDCMQLITGT